MKLAVSVFGALHLPPYTPAMFLARCAATFVAYPAQYVPVTLKGDFSAVAHHHAFSTQQHRAV